MSLRAHTRPLLVIALVGIACAAGAADGATFRVAAGGNDAACAANPDQPCATLAGAVTATWSFNRDVRDTIRLGAGTFPVTQRMTLGAVDLIGVGLGGSLLRMSGEGRIEMFETATANGVAVGGSAPEYGAGARLQLRDSAIGANLVVALSPAGIVPRPNAPVADPGVMLSGQASLVDSIVVTPQAYAGIRVSGAQRVTLWNTSVAGTAPGIATAGGARGGTVLINRVFAQGGVNHASASDMTVANSILTSFTRDGNDAILRGADAGAVTVALSTIWRGQCQTATNGAMSIAGSLVAAACGPNPDQFPALHRTAAGAPITFDRDFIYRDPYSVNVPMGFGPLNYTANPFSPSPWGAVPGITTMPTVGRNVAANYTPVAGSPLIDHVSDAISPAIAAAYPVDLLGTMRTAPYDLGAIEANADPRNVGPGPEGVGIAPGDDGGPAPVLGGLDGAVALPGAPQAGVDGLPRELGAAGEVEGAAPRISVSVKVPKSARWDRPIPVRVTTSGPARVQVVARRPRVGEPGQSRVIGLTVVRVKAAGTTKVMLRLKSAAKRGPASISATASQPGFTKGVGVATLRLTGPQGVVLTVPPTLVAGANRVTVTLARPGRVTVVARRATTNRVLGLVVINATRAGRRTATLTLSPARLVDGSIRVTATSSTGGTDTVARDAG
ncbi:MAG: hypothetical protein FJW99_03050 [Actinobacteria bacterium]|nr:hypothetical protein [Actinomycetota bacterium]